MKNLTRMVLVLAGIAMGAAGCASTGSTKAPPKTPTAPVSGEPAAQATAQPCPMKVPGAVVTSANIEGGVALDFTTTNASSISELRKRVHGLGEAHMQRGTPAAMNTGRPTAHAATVASNAGCPMMSPKTPPAHGAAKMPGDDAKMPEVTTSVEDIDGGARMVLRPSDPARVAEVREHARVHTQHMIDGECPMMTTCMMQQPTAHPAAEGAQAPTTPMP